MRGMLSTARERTMQLMTESITRMGRARLGISWYFLNLGLLVGNYVSRLPSIKDEHHLSDGKLGLVLLSCAIGTMASLPFVSKIDSLIGSGMSTFLASILSAVVVPLIGMNDHKDGTYTLLLGMFSCGFAMGVADVSANAQAVLVEAQAGRPQMGLFHAAYASGSFIGAILGGLFAEARVTPFINIFIVSSVSMCVSFLVLPSLYNKDEEAEISRKMEANARKEIKSLEEKEDANSKGNKHKSNSFNQLLTTLGINKRLLCVSIIGFVAYMAEGSIEDWTTVYYTEVLDASPIMCSLGFAAFSLAIAIGRFLSDGLVQKHGAVRLLQVSGVVSTFGMAIVVLAPLFHMFSKTLSSIVCCIALGIAGAGLSLASPIVSSAAGRVHDMNAVDALSLVTSFGYSGYFIGPPLFGGLAEMLGSLRWSFMVDAALILIIAAAAQGVPEDPAYKALMRSKSSEYEDEEGLLEDSVDISPISSISPTDRGTKLVRNRSVGDRIISMNNAHGDSDRESDYEGDCEKDI